MTRLFVGAIAGILVILLSVNAMFAAPKKAPSPVAKTNTRATALTEGECTGLGGKVDAAVKCSGGQGCYTTDKDGVIHMACLTNKK